MQTSPEFEQCLPFTLIEEGGNSNDPHDPGGRTHKGIIQREYDQYRRSKGLHLQSDYLMSDDEVREIYYTQYWLPHCSELPPGVNLSYFDNCVNEGPYQANRILQRALTIVADAHWGPRTQHAVDNIIDPSVVITRMTDAREAFYRSLTSFKYFGKGWINRCNHINAASLNMAKGKEADV